MRIDNIKDVAYQLLLAIHVGLNEKNGREIALAKTKLEESVMWAVKGITK